VLEKRLQRRFLTHFFGPEQEISLWEQRKKEDQRPSRIREQMPEKGCKPPFGTSGRSS